VLSAPQFCILVLDFAERPSVPSCEDPSTLLLLLPRVVEVEERTGLSVFFAVCKASCVHACLHTAEATPCVEVTHMQLQGVLAVLKTGVVSLRAHRWVHTLLTQSGRWSSSLRVPWRHARSQTRKALRVFNCMYHALHL